MAHSDSDSEEDRRPRKAKAYFTKKEPKALGLDFAEESVSTGATFRNLYAAWLVDTKAFFRARDCPPEQWDEAAAAYREYLALEPSAIDAGDIKDALARRGVAPVTTGTSDG